MTAETALRLGQAAGLLFKRGSHRHKVVIGKDTRLSGYMLEPALTAGFIGAGMDVTLVGPMPTPAVAMLTRSLRADLGVMISASHNPFEDNGIKLFGPDGFKLSDVEELEIEAIMAGDLSSSPGGRRVARSCGPARRRARALRGSREGHLSTWIAAGWTAHCYRLRQRRRLSRGARHTLGTGRDHHQARRDTRRLQHQQGLWIDSARVPVRASGGARGRSRHCARRRRRSPAVVGRAWRADRRRPDPRADCTILGPHRTPARQRRGRDGHVQPWAGARVAGRRNAAPSDERGRPARRGADAGRRHQRGRRAVRPHDSCPTSPPPETALSPPCRCSL